MQFLPGAQRMKDADNYTIHSLGVPSLELMERAAKGCVRYMKEENLDLSKVMIVCGSGNNGGDGFAIGRLLIQEGAFVTVCMAGNVSHCTPECKRQMELFDEAGGVIVNEFTSGEYSVIVDALFGVGLSRKIEGVYADIINKMNESDAVRFAVDIPSGISADTGNVLGKAFRADITVTFQKRKFGMEIYPGKEYCGRIFVEDIGICDKVMREDFHVPVVLTKEEYKNLLPARNEDSNKGTFGKVLVIAGSKGMSGAAYFNAKSAYLSGAGLVRIYTPEENRMILQQLLPEAIITAYDSFCEMELCSLLLWADVVCIGSGIGISDTSRMLLKKTIKNCKVPCVIDADGINLLAEEREELRHVNQGQFVLTPHMKEMSRLIRLPVEEIKKDRLKILEQVTAWAECACVMKDSRTVIGAKDHRTVVNCTGNQAMAKAGSGDVLTGIITGFLAQGLPVYDASVLGAYIHGGAGDLAREKKGNYSVLAEDLMDHISAAIKRLEEE